MATVFEFSSCVRGYHVYKAIWTPFIGETLLCEPEFGNIEDPYAVKIVDSASVTIGHVPRKISTLCHMFLLRSGSIICQITGPRRYSIDLVQGGLEVPCNFIFTGFDRDIFKLKKLINAAPVKCPSINNDKIKIKEEFTGEEQPPSKKLKVDINAIVLDTENMTSDNACNELWLKCYGYFVLQSDKVILEEGGKLNDRHINYAQALLRQQFPLIQGLSNTLLQLRKPIKTIENGIQIVHDRSNHWVVVSNITSSQDTVNVYDSIFSSISDGTREVVMNLFKVNSDTKICLPQMQKQNGENDCGLFAIAVAVLLLHGLHVSEESFQQEKMRTHLCKCFINQTFSLFPSVI